MLIAPKYFGSIEGRLNQHKKASSRVRRIRGMRPTFHFLSVLSSSGLAGMHVCSLQGRGSPYL